MRISDWSSDVCSSDLVGPAVGVPASARERRIAYGMASRLIGALHFQTVCAELVEAPFFLFDARKAARPFDKLSTNGSYLRGNQDRKSVDKGKRMLGSVDVRGRRKLKKKKHKNKQ